MMHLRADGDERPKYGPNGFFYRLHLIAPLSIHRFPDGLTPAVEAAFTKQEPGLERVSTNNSGKR